MIETELYKGLKSKMDKDEKIKAEMIKDLENIQEEFESCKKEAEDFLKELKKSFMCTVTLNCGDKSFAIPVSDAIDYTEGLINRFEKRLQGIKDEINCFKAR